MANICELQFDYIQLKIKQPFPYLKGVLKMNEDEWEYRKVRKPQNTHFGKSTQTPGVERELLYEDGTNKLVGPPESLPVDEKELREHFSPIQSPPPNQTEPQGPTPFQQEIADIITEGINEILDEVVIPYVKNTAIPAAKNKYQERTELRREKKEIKRLNAKKSVERALPTTSFIRHEITPAPAPGDPRPPLFSIRLVEKE